MSLSLGINGRERKRVRVTTLPLLAVTCLVLLLLVAPAARALPDGRAYEQVTPVDKNGGDVGGPAIEGLFASAFGQTSADGNAITYVSLASFGDAQSAELVTQYISSRGTDSWSTHAISPPTTASSGRELLAFSPFHFFTSDLSASLLDWFEPALAVGAPQKYDNLYVRHADGTYSLVTNVSPPNRLPGSYQVAFAGASPDLSHVALEANDALTVGAPANAHSVYEWAGSALRLVSVLPGPGSVAAANARVGDGQGDDLANVVSSDGSRIFWTDGSGQLYVREDGTRTVKLNASRRLASLGDGSAVLRATTPDGSKAIFTDATPLTDASNDNGGGIYEYDTETENLQDLTPYGGGSPGIQGVLGMSTDGSTVYFVASAVLASGASAGGKNLYVTRGGAIEFIAVLGNSDSEDWTANFETRTARVTPNGSHVAFLSQASLTGYNNTDAVTESADRELFVYDVGEARLTCVSCSPKGTRPIGGASIPMGTSLSYEPRIISDDGRRVLFNSNDALVSTDSNGRQDVYEYEDGSVRLISAGTSGDISTLVDMSPEGHDIFFTTRSRLVASDRDNASDIYDARIGGGFAAPPEILPCSADACRGPLSIPPPAPLPATLTGGESSPTHISRRGCRHKSRLKKDRDKVGRAGRKCRTSSSVPRRSNGDTAGRRGSTRGRGV
jgi:hypothetical protein